MRLPRQLLSPVPGGGASARRPHLLSLALAAAFVLLAVFSLRGVPPTRAATPLYPDLITLPSKDLRFDAIEIDGAQHNVLRFTTTIWNAGEGPLELRGDSTTGSTEVYQRIFDDASGGRDVKVGTFVFHPGHEHWHFEQFAENELWTYDDHQLWLNSGRTVGQPLYRSNKTTGGVGFCVRDSRIVKRLPRSPAAKYYDQCETALQGISVGYGDIYTYKLVDQWIDFGDATLPIGRYVLRSFADPMNAIHESPEKSDPTRESPEVNESTLVFEVREASQVRAARN